MRLNGGAVIVDEPQVQCPFCRGFMPGWLSRYPGKACTLCARPLLLVPSTSSVRHRSILSALDVAKVIMLPVMAGATISFGFGRLGIDGFAQIVAASLLAWGVIDVWDGTAGLTTGIDKMKKQIRRGAVARRMSVAKTIFGLFSINVGGLGLLVA
jgi:hypothetical protein